MLRYVVCALAVCLPALLAPVSAAALKPSLAPPDAAACKKVDISFACRTRGSGKASLPCRKGESEAACCARWRASHTNPRTGQCRKRGGVVSYTCGCPKTGGPGEHSRDLRGDRGRLLRRDRMHSPGPGEPGEPDTPTAPGVPGGPPAPPPPPPEPGEPSEPVPPVPPQPGGTTDVPDVAPRGEPEPPCVGPSGPELRRYCLRVKFSYACKSGASGSRSFGCGRGQSQADCCRKIKAGLCNGKLDAKKTGPIQTACRCVQWSKWQTCRPSGRGQKR